MRTVAGAWSASLSVTGGGEDLVDITDVLSSDCIAFDQELSSKEQVFQRLIGMLRRCGAVASEEAFERAVWEREGLAMTGLQDGIAIPHGISPSVTRPAMAYVRLASPLAWESIDDVPVRHVFLLAIPSQGEGEKDAVHIRMLSTLARSLVRPGVIAGIDAARSAGDLLAALRAGQAVMTTA